jgi:HK97 family phage major capsid protein
MATETTVTSPRAWSPDASSFAPLDVIPEALILVTSTLAGSVEGDAPAVRVAWVDDATADFVAEGAVIPEADPVLAETTVYTGKVSQLVRLSREQWGQDGAAERLSESVARAVVKRANEAYIAQAAPTAPAVTPPAGLLNVSGILNGGAVATSLDKLVDLFATIEGNGGTPTHIVLSPVAWASLRKFKTATGSAAGLLGAGTNDSVKMLLDVPVLVSPAVPAGSGLVIDKTAVVSAAGEVQVATSADAYFTSDSIALRCTWRFGANLVRPNRVGKFTVTAP